MRVELDQSTHPRLLRKPALAEASSSSGIKTGRKSRKPKGSRFVGPTQLDEEQKSRIHEALKKKNVGDEIGRQIFIGAVEYQISAFSHRVVHRIEPEVCGPSPALQETLQSIIDNAGILSGLLRGLPDGARAQVTEALATQDELGRGYDERYLRALGCEIDRLERACSAACLGLQPEAPEPDPTSSRELIVKLAGIFSECFETEPTAAEDGPFRAALEILDEVTGLVIGHEPALLAQVLAAEMPNREAS